MKFPFLSRRQFLFNTALGGATMPSVAAQAGLPLELLAKIGDRSASATNRTMDKAEMAKLLASPGALVRIRFKDDRQALTASVSTQYINSERKGSNPTRFRSVILKPKDQSPKLEISWDAATATTDNAVPLDQIKEVKVIRDSRAQSVYLASGSPPIL